MDTSAVGAVVETDIDLTAVAEIFFPDAGATQANKSQETIKTNTYLFCISHLNGTEHNKYHHSGLYILISSFQIEKAPRVKDNAYIRWA